MSGHRTQRMASLIRAELARILIEEVSDPRLREIVITEVELSKDLKQAKVFFTASQQHPVSAKQDKELQRGFSRALPFFRRKIGDNLEIRFVPELEFCRDTHGESVNRLLGIFDDISEHSLEKSKLN